MGNIVLLDDNTINKIAAGEVIERPASVVKELMENSIDAGASNIKVEIKNGGISYIRITDNGKGIMPDDMEIAFERHATSKIRKAEDLETVTSMGFRGEALASVAAISKIEMISKTSENEIGYKIEIEGGKITNKEEAGCPKGTTITIQDLFFNTPVRYKFLKKDFTEAGYIEDAVTRIALVHPEIAIQLISSGKTIIQTPGNNSLKAVVYSIYGKDISENILDVNYEYEDIKVTGVIGKPVIARSNRSNQLFFVNKRYIKDKTLTGAAEQGFKGLITIGKYGFLILNLEVNPKKVDVNVHPAKLEVRFEEENNVFKAVYHAIKDTLLKGDLVADTEKTSDNISFEKTMVANSIPVKNEGQEEKSFTQSLFGRFSKDNKSNKNAEGSSKYQNNEFVDKNAPKENIIAQIYANSKMSTGIENESNKMSAGADNVNNTVSAGLENESNKISAGLENGSNKISANLEKESNKISASSQNENNKSLETLKDERNKFSEILEDESIEKLAKIRNELAENTETYELPISGGVIKQAEKISEEINKLDNLKLENDITNFDEMYTKTFGKLPSELRKAAEEAKQKEKEEKEKNMLKIEDMKSVENISIFQDKIPKRLPPYKFIGIAFSTYIILELGAELYILDQHAAHERILYEKVKKNYYSETEKDSQLMLLPDVINLSHKEMDIAKENMDMFRKAGFTLEEFGENTIKLSGVPNICIDLDTKELFLETLDEINTVARTAKQEKEEKFIATVACKAAVKANMALTKQEVDELMKQLLVLPNPFTCPHGRPTAIRMTKNDIEKKFSRR